MSFIRTLAALSCHSRERGNPVVGRATNKIRMNSRTALVLIVAVFSTASCTNKEPSTEPTVVKKGKVKPTFAKDTGINVDSLVASLDQYVFEGSGGRPVTATQDRWWRWDVKTMRDEPENSWQTRYGMPYQFHYALRALTEFDDAHELEEDTGREFIPILHIQHDSPRLWGSTYLHEYAVINVQARIEGYKLEDDSDIHLILRDGIYSMVAEVPHPKEVGKWAEIRVAAVWKWLIEHFGKPTRKGAKPPDIGPVFVVGMPFIDEKHNVSGEAPNGMEIHPVLGISLPDDN